MHGEESGFTVELLLELKYCERCGGLWLRERGSGLTFCARCAGAMDEPARAEEISEMSYPRLPQARRSAVQDVMQDAEDDFEACAAEVWETSTGGAA